VATAAGGLSWGSPFLVGEAAKADEEEIKAKKGQERGTGIFFYLF
jgi:hypothetical protein